MSNHLFCPFTHDRWPIVHDLSTFINTTGGHRLQDVRCVAADMQDDHTLRKAIFVLDEGGRPRGRWRPSAGCALVGVFHPKLGQLFLHALKLIQDIPGEALSWVYVVDFLYGLAVLVDGDVFLILFQELDADLVGFLSRYTIPGRMPSPFRDRSGFPAESPLSVNLFRHVAQPHGCPPDGSMAGRACAADSWYT
ncbi:hypothetical protein [Acetomicrobium sp.]|uniref:hypothetical protein n=1 Tax=Acetomicrobium sp. TaxID=1872099 RepID=UPI002870D168|nr:hypothetical protein [Acetomicrobium sp.]MDR9768827.1 hypothetical protein [Acetomicrobium sp.]